MDLTLGRSLFHWNPREKTHNMKKKNIQKKNIDCKKIMIVDPQKWGFS